MHKEYDWKSIQNNINSSQQLAIKVHENVLYRIFISYTLIYY